MSDLKIEFEVEFVPLPKEREAAYWDAIRIIVGMIHELLAEEENHSKITKRPKQKRRPVGSRAAASA